MDLINWTSTSNKKSLSAYNKIGTRVTSGNIVLITVFQYVMVHCLFLLFALKGINILYIVK